MYKLFFITVVFVKFSSAVYGQLRSISDLRGIWNGNGLRVEFIDDSKISVVLPDGQKYTGSYHADFFRSPVVLEISCNNGIGKVEFKCLVESIKPNILKWQMFEELAKLPSFTKNFYTLTKSRN